MKRLWQFHFVMEKIEQATLERLKDLILQNFGSNAIVESPYGVKFLGFILTLEPSFLDEIHRTLKTKISAKSRTASVSIGQIFHKV